MSQNIDKEADKVLSQILVPRVLSVFEPKLAMAVNLYLGINNEASQNELNGMIHFIVFRNFNTFIVFNVYI